VNGAWRPLIHVAFFYTCIEGLVINIRYPDILAYVYKDFLLLLVYGLLVLPNLHAALNPSTWLARVTVPLAVFAGMVVLYLAMPSPMDPFSRLVAFKQRIFYLPLVLVGYAFVRTSDDVRGLFQMLTVYAIGVSLFGIYLFFTGPAGLERLGARYSAVIMTAPYRGAQVYWRVPGTFTSPGQYGVYLLFNGLVAFALVLLKSASRSVRAVALGSLVLLVLAMLASGSRAPVVLFSASVAVLLLVTFKVTRVAAWGLLGYAVFAYGFVFFGPAVADRFASVASAEHVMRFRATYFGQLFLPQLAREPFGAGLGVATIGARHFAEEMSEVELVESYLGILAREMGVLGLGSFLWVSAAILVVTWSLRGALEDPDVKLLWHALAVYVVLTVLIFPVSTSIDHAPTNFYFWFSVGALVRLAELEQWRRWLATAATAAVAADSSPVVQPASSSSAAP
jgi:hypothetical protein